MEAYIEAKVKFNKRLENGKFKKVNEPYLVNAASFTEAEARVTEAVRPFISGDFTVSAVTKSNIVEVFRHEDGDFWYKVKANFITIDEKSGAEKINSVYYLVQAPNFKRAYDNFMQDMKGTLGDFEVVGIVETAFMDVIEPE